MNQIDPLNAFLSELVAVDTDGPILYLGRLAEVTDSGLVLTEADVHDCREGHASKEAYLAEALEQGVTVNRRKVVVLRRVIMSVSRLADIVLEDSTGADDLPEGRAFLEED
ncbi:MAG: hypothetical protein FLDDKLPJ_01117 [Phycisphaerae bacterium]|nr:hypothetical protein [Phycisphaerae bacterium]